MSKKEKLIEKLAFLENYKAKLEAKKGLRDLYFFNKHIIEKGNPKRQKNIVPHVHGEWWEWYKNSKKRLKLILVPRHTLKSTFFTVGMTLQRIAKNRDIRILIANATRDNACLFLSEIKQHIRENKNYIENYGEMYEDGLTWKEDEIVVAGRSPSTRNPTVSAAGVGGNLVSRHYDLIIADDLMNEQNVNTREQAEKVKDWWRRAMSLLSPQGEMLTIGTRWSHFDLYQYILDELPHRVDSYVRAAKENGELYYPEMLDYETLDELREMQGSYIYSSFYMNDPVDESSALIKKQDIHYYDIECPCGERHRKPDRAEMSVFVMCDPAVSQRVTADFSSIITAGIDEENNWWVLEAKRGRWTVNELIGRLFETSNSYNADGVSIEVIGQAQTLLATIHDHENVSNQFLPLTEIKSRGGKRKQSRIRSSLQARFERGKVFIDSRMNELENELLRYPRSKHDDMIDALTDLTEIGFPPSYIDEEKNRKPATIQERVWASLKNRDEHVDSVLGSQF